MGLYCLNHHETQFSLSVMLRKTSSFLGFVAILYTIFSSWNTFTLLLSTELPLERIFIWKFLGNVTQLVCHYWHHRGPARIIDLPLVGCTCGHSADIQDPSPRCSAVWHGLSFAESMGRPQCHRRLLGSVWLQAALSGEIVETSP